MILDPVLIRLITAPMQDRIFFPRSLKQAIKHYQTQENPTEEHQYAVLSAFIAIKQKSYVHKFNRTIKQCDTTIRYIIDCHYGPNISYSAGNTTQLDDVIAGKHMLIALHLFTNENVHALEEHSNPAFVVKNLYLLKDICTQQQFDFIVAIERLVFVDHSRFEAHRHVSTQVDLNLALRAIASVGCLNELQMARLMNCYKPHLGAVLFLIPRQSKPLFLHNLRQALYLSSFGMLFAKIELNALHAVGLLGRKQETMADGKFVAQLLSAVGDANYKIKAALFHRLSYYPNVLNLNIAYLLLRPENNDVDSIISVINLLNKHQLNSLQSDFIACLTHPERRMLILHLTEINHEILNACLKSPAPARLTYTIDKIDHLHPGILNAAIIVELAQCEARILKILSQVLEPLIDANLFNEHNLMQIIVYLHKQPEQYLRIHMDESKRTQYTLAVILRCLINAQPCLLDQKNLDAVLAHSNAIVVSNALVRSCIWKKDLSQTRLNTILKTGVSETVPPYIAHSRLVAAEELLQGRDLVPQSKHLHHWWRPKKSPENDPISSEQGLSLAAYH